jgi:hypothetical protein
MLYIKNNPVGIDKPIISLQRVLFSTLKTKWGLTDQKYNSFGRAYRNKTDNGFIAEVFSGGNDYREVYFDDNVSATSFFGTGQESPVDGTLVTANVHLVFFVDLTKIKSGTNRNDEEARLDVFNVLSTVGAASGWVVNKQVTGIDKVLAEYTETRKDKGLLARDQQPLHCFRFDCQVFYQPTLTEC